MAHHHAKLRQGKKITMQNEATCSRQKEQNLPKTQYTVRFWLSSFTFLLPFFPFFSFFSSRSEDCSSCLSSPFSRTKRGDCSSRLSSPFSRTEREGYLADPILPTETYGLPILFFSCLFAFLFLFFLVPNCSDYYLLILSFFSFFSFFLLLPSPHGCSFLSSGLWSHSSRISLFTIWLISLPFTSVSALARPSSKYHASSKVSVVEPFSSSVKVDSSFLHIAAAYCGKSPGIGYSRSPQTPPFSTHRLDLVLSLPSGSRRGRDNGDSLTIDSYPVLVLLLIADLKEKGLKVALFGFKMGLGLGTRVTVSC